MRACMQLSALDHGAMLTCVNPKALRLSGALDGAALRQALALALHSFPTLAGRCGGASPSTPPSPACGRAQPCKDMQYRSLSLALPREPAEATATHRACRRAVQPAMSTHLACRCKQEAQVALLLLPGGPAARAC